MLRGLRFLFSAKKMVFGQQCLGVIADTALEVSRVASVTLGPMGRNVLIENDRHAPRVTKDGVTVVKHIEYEDRLKDAVCTLIKKSVDSTNRFAGDGTTTSSLLIGAIIKEARRYLQAGYSSRQIKQGLKAGRDLGIDFIRMAAQPIDSQEAYYKVAMIATKGDSLLSSLISEAVSRSELIKVEKTQRTESYVEYLSGLKMTAGIPHPEFKNVGDRVQLNHPLVLLDSLGINSIEQVVQALEMAKKARKQLLIVSNSISDSVMSNLIYNKRKNIVEAFPVLLHGYGSITQDYFRQLSKSTGAEIFGKYGPCEVRDIKFEHFGRATRVQIDEFQTTVFGRTEKDITNAVIYAGGSTEEVTLEVYDKAIDALNSVKTAKKHGVVAGGGVTFWRMADMLDQYQYQGGEAVGVKILASALREPRRALVQHVPDYFRSLGGTGWEGYNFKTGEVEDMLEAGILDSASVGQNVLLDSVSLAQMLIDTEVAIVRAQSNNESSKQVDRIQDSYRM